MALLGLLYDLETFTVEEEILDSIAFFNLFLFFRRKYNIIKYSINLITLKKHLLPVHVP